MKDKWGRRLFVTGAILLILLGLVHSLSLLEKQVPANETERQLLDLMSNYKFDVMGSMRSMNDFLRGFSVAFMVGMIGMGVLDLVLARERAALLKRVALVNVVWMAVMAVVGVRYFFIAPVSLMVATLVIFALAWLNLPASAS
jgi:hypothetical protein